MVGGIAILDKGMYLPGGDTGAEIDQLAPPTQPEAGSPDKKSPFYYWVGFGNVH